MTADRRPNIQTPWDIRVRRLVQGLPLQAIMFVCLAIAVAYLWSRQAQAPNSVGRVEAVRINVSTAASGKLLRISELVDGQWNQFDPVYKGQVVARLDDSELQADLAAFVLETEALRAELSSTEFKLDADRLKLSAEHLKAASDLAREVERWRLDILDRLTELEQDRLELSRLESQLKLAEGARSSGILGSDSLAELQMQHDTQAKLVASRSGAYRLAQENHRAAL
jgi:multidrug resistance efflux pump